MGKDKNVPTLRFPGFEGEWEEKTLGEVSKDIMYGMNAAAIPFDGTNKYLRITDIDEGSRLFSPAPLTSPDGKVEDKYRLKLGDIVFARTGASVGKSYLYDPKDGNLLFAGFLIKFSIVDVNAFFVFCHTLGSEYDKWVVKMSMRSGQPGLNAEEYKELKLSFPTLPEQTKIADFLSAVDEKLQALKKKKAALESYKKGLMQQLFSQALRFKDQDGNDFPDWEEKRLGEVADRVSLKNRSNQFNFVLTNSATQGIVSQGEYFDRDIANQNNLEGYYIVSLDDFVYNPRISVHAPVGPIKRNKLQQGVMSPLYSVFRFKVDHLAYFEFYFETTGWHEYLENVANSGARHDRMNITVSDFFNMPIPIPVDEERKKIADFLSSLDAKIQGTALAVEKLEVWKKGLLQRLFV